MGLVIKAALGALVVLIGVCKNEKLLYRRADSTRPRLSRIILLP